jgi:hypothetical protein
LSRRDSDSWLGLLVVAGDSHRVRGEKISGCRPDSDGSECWRGEAKSDRSGVGGGRAGVATTSIARLNLQPPHVRHSQSDLVPPISTCCLPLPPKKNTKKQQFQEIRVASAAGVRRIPHTCGASDLSW